jgi:hypothetical protein
MGIKTAIALVPFVGDGRYEAPSGILVDERAFRLARGRARGNLYILVEVSTELAGREFLAMQLADAIQDVYYKWRGSITAGLQEAIRQANKLLFDENRNALAGERRTAGVSCAVLRRDDLFIAQAGPGAIFLARQGQVTRLPDVSPWLDDVPPEEVDAAPLGVRREANVFLYHTQVGEDDTLLLVESEPARSVPEHAWPRILSAPTVEGILDGLLASTQMSDSPALAIRLFEGEAEAAPARARRGTGPVPVTVAGPVEGEVEAAPEPVLERSSSWAAQSGLGHRLQRVGRAFAALGAGLLGALLALLRGLIPGQVSPAPEPVSETVERKGRKSKPAASRQEGAERNDLLHKLLIVVAVAIPLIVAAIVLATYVQRGQVQRAELDQLWQEADARWNQAQETTDQAAVRTLLTEAQGMLDQLLERKSSYPGAADLQDRIQARLDEINQVRRITWLAPLHTYPGSADLSRVVVEGIHIFVMDRNGGKVYHHQMDEFQQSLTPDSEDTVLVSKGDQVGDVVVGDLVDMTWMPVGNNRQTANLLILTSNGSLIQYDPATEERVALKVADAGTWQFPRLVGGYYGRFYVLDPTANEIWRYDPTPDGYSDPPAEWLESEVDLAGIVDMAIGNSIFLAYADGKMRKLTAGGPDTFDISDWDLPPANPGAIFTRPPEETRWVYLADRGNSRIVQCSDQGQFKRQFRLADASSQEAGDPLARVTSLFVDEISAHAFFLSGQQLYLAVLPD